MADHLDYLDLSSLSWKRPAGPLKVWRVVEGRKKTEDGKTLRFSIQDVPRDREEEVVDFMCNNFMREEPTCVSKGMSNDPLAVKEFRSLWRSFLRQGICVVGLIDDPEGGKPAIAGVNMLCVFTKQDKEFLETLKFKSEKGREVMAIILSLTQEADVYSKYGEDKYMAAFGLSALPTMRGQGLGEHILRAREDIGREFQIPVTETVFTAVGSQIIADRAGYEVLVERKYCELLNEKGEEAFPGVTVPSMKVMARRLY